MHLQSLMNLMPALIVLGILIFIHELGHFIACRIFGVRVEKFSIGFGPELFHWQGKETRYALSLIPLGGFVKPSGESHEEMEEGGPKPHDFLAKGTGPRFVIAFAGILMNFLLAYVLFVGIFTVGRPVMSAKIGSFVENYPAAVSELKKGDLVLAVNGALVKNWRELTEKIFDAGSREILFNVSRDGAPPVEVSVLPKVEQVKDVFGKEHTLARIGILPSDDYSVEKYPFPAACVKAGETVGTFTVLTLKSMAYLATGKLSLKNVSGPIGIFSIASKTAQQGMIHLLQLTAFLSASLAVFNLLPFSPLDGGLMLFIAIEAIRKKAVSLKVQDTVTKAGFALLMALMVVVMYNDLVNIEFFSKIKNLFPK